MRTSQYGPTYHARILGSSIKFYLFIYDGM
jgi:hypothetical protein